MFSYIAGAFSVHLFDASTADCLVGAFNFSSSREEVSIGSLIFRITDYVPPEFLVYSETYS